MPCEDSLSECSERLAVVPYYFFVVRLLHDHISVFREVKRLDSLVGRLPESLD